MSFKYNLIPSEQIMILVTENSEYSSSYSYRVFEEFYEQEDADYGKILEN
jgi:hypothetical protein